MFIVDRFWSAEHACASKIWWNILRAATYWMNFSASFLPVMREMASQATEEAKHCLHARMA